jgi:hypothetical protein
VGSLKCAILRCRYQGPWRSWVKNLHQEKGKHQRVNVHVIMGSCESDRHDVVGSIHSEWQRRKIGQNEGPARGVCDMERGDRREVAS